MVAWVWRECPAPCCCCGPVLVVRGGHWLILNGGGSAGRVGEREEEDLSSQREQNVLVFKTRKIRLLAHKLNATQKHSGIIKQMAWELVTKNMLVPE